jgi:hypothetical protein
MSLYCIVFLPESSWASFLDGSEADWMEHPQPRHKGRADNRSVPVFYWLGPYIWRETSVNSDGRHDILQMFYDPSHILWFQ